MVFDEVVTLADTEEFAKQPIHRSRRRILDQCKAVDGVCPFATAARTGLLPNLRMMLSQK
jgi:hypothetical protein